MTGKNSLEGSVEDVVTDALVTVTGIAEVRTAPDLKIRELGILDSLGVVSLILALSERLGIAIVPAELEEENLATPRAIAAFVRGKLETPPAR